MSRVDEKKINTCYPIGIKFEAIPIVDEQAFESKKQKTLVVGVKIRTSMFP